MNFYKKYLLFDWINLDKNIFHSQNYVSEMFLYGIRRM